MMYGSFLESQANSSGLPSILISHLLYFLFQELYSRALYLFDTKNIHQSFQWNLRIRHPRRHQLTTDDIALKDLADEPALPVT